MEECLAELRSASERLDRKGFWWRPTWHDLREGQRPPETPEISDPGEWRHGWQYWSSSVSDSHFRKEAMLHSQTAARRAHRSHSGYNAGLALAHCPTAPEFTIPAHLFRTLLLERMHLPLQVTERRCEGCHAGLDSFGHHRASCTRKWPSEEAGNTPGTGGGSHVPRGWRNRPTERLLEGHERPGASRRPKKSRSPRTRPALLRERAVGSGRHFARGAERRRQSPSQRC